MSREFIGKTFLVAGLAAGPGAAMVLEASPVAAATTHKTTTEQTKPHNNHKKGNGTNGKVEYHSTTTTTQPIAVNSEGVVTNICELVDQTADLQSGIEQTLEVGSIQKAKCLNEEPTTDTFNDGNIMAFARWISPVAVSESVAIGGMSQFGSEEKKVNLNAEADIWGWSNFLQLKNGGTYINPNLPQDDSYRLGIISQDECNNGESTPQIVDGNPGLVCDGGQEVDVLIHFNGQEYVLRYASSTDSTKVSTQEQTQDGITTVSQLAQTAFK